MLAFYSLENCLECEEVSETLLDLTLAHKTVVVKGGAALDGLPPGIQPPALVDDGKVFEGIHAIRNHLSELSTLRRKWQQFQSDVCYPNECGDE